MSEHLDGSKFAPYCKCPYCTELEAKGDRWIGVNGAKGVALLLVERDKLLKENKDLLRLCEKWAQFAEDSNDELLKIRVLDMEEK